MAKAHAAAIPDRPPQKRHCTKCCAAAPPFCFMHKFRRKIPCIFWKGNDTLSMEHSTEVLYNRTMVYCTPEHRFGSDALLLARFCEPKRSQKAADLCSGCGIVALEWHDRGHRGPCTALELQPEGSALLAAAVEEQQLPTSFPSVPTCAHGGRTRGNLTCARAIPLILPRGRRARTPPTPLPGTKTPALWRMSVPAASGF